MVVNIVVIIDIVIVFARTGEMSSLNFFSPFFSYVCSLVDNHGFYYKTYRMDNHYSEKHK